MRRCRAKAAVAERVAAAPWSLLVAIALTGSSPARSKAGMVNNPPPPAMASKQPAKAATANRAVRPPKFKPLIDAAFQIWLSEPHVENIPIIGNLISLG
jgi:hypothetical protein